MLDLTWMAWTWPTAAFFVAVVLSIVIMGSGKISAPAATRAAASSASTRRVATACSFPGSAPASFTSAGWAFYGTPLWGALAIAIAWFVFVFRKV